MANMWGNHLLGPNASHGWYFKRPAQPGFLPYISIYPLGLQGYFVYTTAQWFLTGGGYPYWDQLGVSTQWCQYSPYDPGTGQSMIFYYIVVQNNSMFPLQYAFVEADF